jgi:hypothetical protein
MGIEGLNVACISRRDRLRRDRLVTAVAMIATTVAFAFVIFASYGGFK